LTSAAPKSATNRVSSASLRTMPLGATMLAFGPHRRARSIGIGDVGHGDVGEVGDGEHAAAAGLERAVEADQAGVGAEHEALDRGRRCRAG
jgi:hypothetical protein